jgi:hypothetical protein
MSNRGDLAFWVCAIVFYVVVVIGGAWLAYANRNRECRRLVKVPYTHEGARSSGGSRLAFYTYCAEWAHE